MSWTARGPRSARSCDGLPELGRGPEFLDADVSMRRGWRADWNCHRTRGTRVAAARTEGAAFDAADQTRDDPWDGAEARAGLCDAGARQAREQPPRVGVAGPCEQ